MSVNIDVQGNDIDDGDTLTTTVPGGMSAQGGTVVILNGDSINYTPPANFSGMDTITYIVCDTATPPLCDTAQIIITVNPVNDPPVAVNDTATTTDQDPIVIDAQANDSDIDGDTLTITTVSYTHLRAHETRGNLVCRLLLEKKK